MKKLPHELLKTLIEAMTFPINYTSVSNSGDIYTLHGIYHSDCESELNPFHHAQPGMYVTIAGNRYSFEDYDYEAKTLIVKGTVAITALTFNLYTPFFFHGTPMQQQAELGKIQETDRKIPMIYLMEPYRTENDYSYDSAIDYRSDIKLCFLTQVHELPSKVTDDIYYMAIYPMHNLMEEVMQAIINSPLFYTNELKSNPIYYTKFGINVSQTGTKQMLFTEDLAGVGNDLKMQVYKVDGCEC